MNAPFGSRDDKATSHIIPFAQSVSFVQLHWHVDICEWWCGHLPERLFGPPETLRQTKTHTDTHSHICTLIDNNEIHLAVMVGWQTTCMAQPAPVIKLSSSPARRRRGRYIGEISRLNSVQCRRSAVVFNCYRYYWTNAFIFIPIRLWRKDAVPCTWALVLSGLREISIKRITFQFGPLHRDECFACENLSICVGKYTFSSLWFRNAFSIYKII